MNLPALFGIALLLAALYAAANNRAFRNTLLALAGIAAVLFLGVALAAGWYWEPSFEERNNEFYQLDYCKKVLGQSTPLRALEHCVAERFPSVAGVGQAAQPAAPAHRGPVLLSGFVGRNAGGL